MALVLATAAPAAAAPAAVPGVPSAEILGAYSYLREEDEGFHGWNLAAGWSLTRRLNLVVDVSQHYGEVAGTDFTHTTFTAGPAFAFARDSSVSPFVHLLAGLIREKASIRVLDVEIAETESDFGGLAGAGVDFGIGSRWAVRIQGDYRLVQREGETQGALRVSAGVLLRVGRK
jgi:hypothetical protein